MASFQQDFNLDNLKTLVDNFTSSAERRKMIDGMKYYKGSNPFIDTIVKTYWSDKFQTMKENPYVSNYKVKSNKFHDIVSQKVNTLLGNAPTIQTDYNDFPKRYVNNVGYALKTAGTKAAAQKVAFIYVAESNKLTVFDSENCLPFYDDETGMLRALIRFWVVNAMSGGKSTTYCEVYEEDGMTLYKDFKIERSKTGYKFIKKVSALDDETINIDIGALPIVMLKNNDDLESDLTEAVKTKIDAKDLVESGFLDNIEDFSDIFWVIKNGGGMDSDEFEDFVASINKTKKILVSGDEGGLDVDTKQIEIPTTARQAFCDRMDKELIEETGVIDTATMTGSSLTTTAIQAATMKLQQRVSDFEWQVYNAMVQIVELYQRYNNATFEFEIDFTKLLIKNDTEIITNATMLRPNISRKSFLKLIKRADYIDDVDEEIKELEEESKSNYSIIDIPDDNPDDPNKDDKGDNDNATNTNDEN